MDSPAKRHKQNPKESEQMELNGFSAELKARLEEWFRWDKNIDTKAEIEDLVKARDEKELNKRMLTRMEFGTAGQNESEVELSFF